MTRAVASDAVESSAACAVPMTTLRRLSRLSPLLSTAHILGEWIFIAGIVVACEAMFHPVLYVIAVMLLGARQHNLFVLMHEGAHYRLFRNRRLNDWTAEIVLAFPLLLLRMRAYRRNHLLHHQHLNSDDDPDWRGKRTAAWAFPKSRWQMARMLLLDLSGFGLVQTIVRAVSLPASPRGEQPEHDEHALRTARVAFLVVLAAVLTVTGAWWHFLIYWVVPFATWTQLCLHLRSIAEHFAISGRSGPFAETRTVRTSWFDRLFIIGKNGNYHLEHHLYPSVPFYRLPELHTELMRSSVYRRSAHISDGYLGVLRECVAPVDHVAGVHAEPDGA